MASRHRHEHFPPLRPRRPTRLRPKTRPLHIWTTSGPRLRTVLAIDARRCPVNRHGVAVRGHLLATVPVTVETGHCHRRGDNAGPTAGDFEVGAAGSPGHEDLLFGVFGVFGVLPAQCGVRIVEPFSGRGQHSGVTDLQPISNYWYVNWTSVRKPGHFWNWSPLKTSFKYRQYK